MPTRLTVDEIVEALRQAYRLIEYLELDNALLDEIRDAAAHRIGENIITAGNVD